MLDFAVDLEAHEQRGDQVKVVIISTPTCCGGKDARGGPCVKGHYKIQESIVVDARGGAIS